MLSVKARLKRLFAGAKVDAILIMNNTTIDPNFYYVTGMESGHCFDESPLIVMRNKMILITDPREYGVAKKLRPKEMQIANVRGGKRMLALLKKYMKGKVIGVNASFMSYNRYKRLKRLTKARRFVDVTRAFYNTRSIKDNAELQNIKKANSIIKSTLRKIPNFFKEGITELEIASKVDEIMVEYGASGPSFSTIVCFGKNSAMPHHIPDSTKLEKNSFVLIDCGAKYKNYCSDVTRTFIFKPDKESTKYKKMLEMYNIVKEAQKLALQNIKADVRCNLPHNKAENYINRAVGGKYKGKFTHALGHAIGIEVHDLGPNFYPGAKEKIRENMVFSDEPGIYIDGFGGVRIEDDVLVTKNGGKII